MTVKQFAVRFRPEGTTETVQAAKTTEAAIVQAAVSSEEANRRAEESAARLAKRYAVMAEAARSAAQAEAAQGRFNAALGVGAAGSSARDSAAVFMADDGQAQRAAALKAILDPLGAAQDRYNEELREFSTLATAGKISQTELAQAQALAKTRLDETTVAIQRQERGLTRLALASRLNLARQGADVAVTAAMGMNPAMIAIQQGPQIMDAWATSAIKLSPAIIALGVTVTALAGATALLGAAYLKGESDANAYEKAVSGIGRTARITSGELRGLVEASAEQGQVSVTAAREMAAAYLETGKIGKAVLDDLIIVSRDYASFTNRELKAAVQDLAVKMGDPAKAARDMTREFGLLDQETLKQIESLDKLGKRTEAQALLLVALSRVTEGHADKVGQITNAWDQARVSMSNYWTWLGDKLHEDEDERLANLDRRIVAFQNRGRTPENSIGLAEALRERSDIYSRRSDEAWKARRQAAQQEDQLQKDLQDARDKANARGAGERRRLAAEAERERREALQRARREEDILAGRQLEIARIKMNFDDVRRLEDENAVRARTRQLIDDGTKAEAARTQALREQAELIEAREAAGAKEAKRLSDQASTEADRIAGMNRFVAAAERRAELEARVLAYAKEYDKVTARSMAKLDQAMVDQARVKAAARDVATAEDERQLRLAQLRGDWRSARQIDLDMRVANRAREIERRGVNGKPLNYGEGVGQAREEIAEEVRAGLIGARQGWAIGLVGDIRQSGLKGAVANQLMGASDRMIEHLIEQMMKVKWGSLIGGARAGWVGKAIDWLVGGNADGTNDWRGGLTWVGERGPELMNLPRGTEIAPHGESLALMRRPMTPAPAPQRPVVFDLRGAVVTQELLAEINRMQAAGLATIRREVPGIAVGAVSEMQERSHGQWL